VEFWVADVVDACWNSYRAEGEEVSLLQIAWADLLLPQSDAGESWWTSPLDPKQGYVGKVRARHLLGKNHPY